MYLVLYSFLLRSPSSQNPDMRLPYRFFFFSSRRRHTRSLCDWSSDVCSSDLFSSAVSLCKVSAYLALLRVYLAKFQYPLALQWLTALLNSAEQVARVGSIIEIGRASCRERV